MKLTSCAREAATICPAPCDLWPFDLGSGAQVTCDMGYFCANFLLPGHLCPRLRPDVRRQTLRQTDVRQTSDVRQHHCGGIINVWIVVRMSCKCNHKFKFSGNCGKCLSLCIANDQLKPCRWMWPWRYVRWNIYWCSHSNSTASQAWVARPGIEIDVCTSPIIIIIIIVVIVILFAQVKPSIGLP